MIYFVSLIIWGFISLLSICGGTSIQLQPANFDSEVLNDERVWLIKFYSPMCGACGEFAPTFTKLESALKSIVTTSVNIDDTDGMNLAKSLGVLDEGLPNIRMFSSTSSKKGLSVLSGDSGMKLKELVQIIKENVAGLSKRNDGYFVKSH